MPSANPAEPDPRHVLEPSPRWVRVRFAGQFVADSRRVLLLREPGRVPVYYFPREDVRAECLVPAEHAAPGAGTGALCWTVQVGDRTAEDAAWGYREPPTDRPTLRGHVTFDWAKMDAWFEEDDEVYVHARDPYKRVDVLHSSRHVQVVVAGTLVAETRRPALLFETGLPTRYYLPKTDVRLDLLVPTETETRCPYKGVASYYAVGGRSDGGPGHRLVLPPSDPGVQQDREPHLLLQRARRRALRRRRAPGEAADAVVGSRDEPSRGAHTLTSPV